MPTESESNPNEPPTGTPWTGELVDAGPAPAIPADAVLLEGRPTDWGDWVPAGWQPPSGELVSANPDAVESPEPGIPEGDGPGGTWSDAGPSPGL